MGSTEQGGVGAAVKNIQSSSSSSNHADQIQGASPSNASVPASGLTGSVGIGAANAPDDVYAVSSALSENGLMNAPQRVADNTLYKGIIGAQERMDSYLKRDGLVNPGGPTEQTYNKLAGQELVQTPAPAPSPKPATGNEALNAEITATKKQNAVKDAKQTVIAGIGNDTRSDFRKAQDRDRLDNAKADAKAAKARAVDLENQRRQREQQQQLEQAQRTNKLAERQTQKARQQVNKGLSTLAKKAGELTGNLIKNALEGQSAQSSTSSRTLASRRGQQVPSGEGYDPGPMGAATPDDGRMEGDGSRLRAGMTDKVELTDEAFQSNQRLAAALSKRRGVGDLPTYTRDAITTDPKRAIPEIADIADLDFNLL